MRWLTWTAGAIHMSTGTEGKSPRSGKSWPCGKRKRWLHMCGQGGGGHGPEGPPGPVGFSNIFDEK